MSNENHSASGEDEYQFPKDEYVVNEQHTGSDTGHADDATQQHTVLDDEQEQETSPRTSGGFTGFVASLKQRLPFLKNKRLLIVIVVIIVALIGFKFFEGSDTTQVAVQKPVQQPVQPVVTRPSPLVTGELSTLSQRASSNLATMSQLKDQVAQLKASLHASTSAQMQMNQSLNSLVDEVKVLDQKVAKATKKPKKHVKKAPPPPPIVYHIKAIISGRAWLVDNHDNSVTVSVGAKVQQYGTVKAINAQKGLVLTSSGKVIGYGANDF